MGVTGDLSEINSLMMIIHRNISLVGNISTLYVSYNKKIHRRATAKPYKTGVAFNVLRIFLTNRNYKQ